MTWNQLTKWYSLAQAAINRYPRHADHIAIGMEKHDRDMRCSCSCGQYLRITNSEWVKYPRPPAIQEHWTMKQKYGAPI